jgi:hypothetical protein
VRLQPVRRGHAMMISQPAVLCLSVTWRRLTGRFAADAEPALPHVLAGAVEVAPPVFATDVAEPYRQRSASPESARPVPGIPEQSQMAVHGTASVLPLSANERRARAAALRALALSRGRRFDAAGAAFTEAARLDPLLDLTRTPAFWKLERAAHEAAVDAYVQAGRERDAAVLRARVQSTFRPKPLRPRQHVVLTP